MNKYEQGKIYKIINDVDDMVYVGSTIQLLRQRFSSHIYKTKKENSKLLNHIKLLGKDNFQIVLLHNYPCKNKEQLLWEERRIQEEIPKEKSLNQLRSIITYDEHEEWFEQNKDYLKKRSRICYEKNKTQVNMKNKENYIRNKE